MSRGHFVYMTHLQSGSEWAMKMFDSTGKPESGILTGGRTFLGMYSECIEALPQAAPLAAAEDYSQPMPAFTSTYCLSSVRLDSEQRTQKQGVTSSICKKLSGADISTGVCVPSTCTEEDVNAIATFVLCQSGCNGNATSTRCRTKTESWNTDIAAMAVTSFIVLLALVAAGATITDYSGRLLEKRKRVHLVIDDKKSHEATFTQSKQVPRFENKAKKLFLCFSLLENGTKLFGRQSPKTDSIGVLHGLRFFCIAWVISIHNRIIPRYTNVFRNSADMAKVNLMTTIIDRGTLAVDTFLFIGGFLAGYINLKYLEKNNGENNWLLAYVHRYFRTMPLLMSTVAICAFLMHYFGDGPLWMDIIGPYESSCRYNWWTNLLNLQNFIHTNNVCLPHTWYSAVDFQLYLISPIFIYLLHRWPRVGMAVCGVLVVASTVFSTVFTAVNGVGSVPGVYDYMQDVYMKPYFRIATYLIGILLGHYIVYNKEGIALKKCYECLGWLVCLFCLLFALLGLRIINPAVQSPLRGAFHAAAPTFWCLGIAWIVYASMAGCGGFITNFLSCGIFELLSKLVFAVYIVHQPLMYVFLASRQESFDYNYFLMGYFFVGNLMLSFAVAAVLSLLIEMPMSGLEKIILGRE
ncbi:O-acyltransferase like protein-like isoform X2 [Dermacentor silvarum]|uniref:O-acyltransferase like protein-like isoform X2 n=1 Tax=Dermacentor silvarum TaxID=543639 RepID=UPI0021015DDC|nr:O-acyltransferase like protein-like isoform X2 [Dermacentor silvarum]